MTDTRLTLPDVQGPLADLFGKLAGKDGEVWLRGLNKFLRKENAWEKPEIFKTIEIGTHKNVKALRKALEDAGFRIGDWAGNILNKTKLSRSKQTLDLVVMSVKELGFPNGATNAQIFEARKNFGLELCPAEVGPQLRLQYADQPAGEWLVVTMEPIKNSDGDLRLFSVGRDSYDRWLYASSGRPDGSWDPDLRFVFVRRK